jgi:uncharacterized protein YuzE
MHFPMTTLARFFRHPICLMWEWMGAPMEISEDRLNLRYEADHDLLSVWLGAPALADAVEVEPGVCVRVSENGAVIGLEVVDAAARLKKDASTLQSRTYAKALMRKYGRIALTELAHAR